MAHQRFPGSLKFPRPFLFWLAHVLRKRPVSAEELEVNEVDVPVDGLAEPLHGFRIAHVSDLHVGDHDWMPRLMPFAVQALRDAQPDLILNTGDYLQWEPDLEKPLSFASMLLLAPPAGLQSQDVNVGILGNHDYYASEAEVAALRAGLEGLGIRMLVNDASCLQHAGAGISIVGLTMGAPGFERGIEMLEESSSPRIVLIHEPDLAERLPPRSADLFLAGHTHGGQITLPGLERPITRTFCGSNYVSGMYEINGMPVYVNRGLGYTGFPFRFRVRPEITIFRLCPPST